MNEAIINWLSNQQDNMLSLLQELVNIDSNSFDKAGVDMVGRHLISFFKQHNISHEIIPLKLHGDAIKATVGGGTGNKTILLCGHRDTVFAKGEVQNRPFSIVDGKAYGPGVADMKPGLVINAFILAAFQRFGGHPNPIVALFTGDEEIGSPESKKIIVLEAEKARLAFNSEPSRPNGNIVTSRKGGIFCHCEITGVAAHSGGYFEDGRSAIEELARKIQSLHKLTNLDRGITINVGLVSGGQSVNTVAASASCDIDIRYCNGSDRDQILKEVFTICEQTTVESTVSSIQICGEFSPLNSSEKSRELFELYKNSAVKEGVLLEGEQSGGCADSGFIADAGTPVICGVGPVGGNYHRTDEWMTISTLSQRARFITNTILTLSKQETMTGL